MHLVLKHRYLRCHRVKRRRNCWEMSPAWALTTIGATSTAVNTVKIDLQLFIYLRLEKKGSAYFAAKKIYGQQPGLPFAETFLASRPQRVTAENALSWFLIPLSLTTLQASLCPTLKAQYCFPFCTLPRQALFYFATHWESEPRK